MMKKADKEDKVKKSQPGKRKTSQKSVSEKKGKEGASAYASKKNKNRETRRILRGQAHIKSTYNNTMVTITDLNGNVLSWNSSGRLGFKGAKKSTPYAASLVVGKLVPSMKSYGMEEIDVFLKGIGAGRESAVRALHGNGFKVMSIKDVTPIPHNGCRPKKPRRV
ncbi:MAG: 30S ribosomal protein S11 [uncultured bacterium]|nr:MAG: 30S ribosomal protein S11 [uncultured bacterium]